MMSRGLLMHMLLTQRAGARSLGKTRTLPNAKGPFALVYNCTQVVQVYLLICYDEESWCAFQTASSCGMMYWHHDMSQCSFEHGNDYEA